MLLIATTAQAGNQAAIEQLLGLDDAPFGVVFEIVERDEDALQWAIPAIDRYVRQLRERFPDIGLAVVSHGREEFALLKSRQADSAPLHQAVRSLVSDDVPVLVCGTHASWRNKDADDFPDYVDVTPAGPTAIRNYEAMGYVLIELKKE
ncbi:MAG TPA: hypothetical protein ENK51_06425 [Gammaproteobacteria bacterium]|nr:hypothetical protein [Gammaproteobacteria bacterium]